MRRLLFFFGFGTALFGQNVTLSLGSGSGIAGGSVTVPISVSSSGGAQAAALQFSIGTSSGITGVTVTIAGSGIGAQKSLACLGGTCVIYGINQNVIADGPVATATLQLAGAVSGSSIPVQLTSAIAADPQGNAIPSTATSGSISVAAIPVQITSLDCSPTALRLNASAACTIILNSAASSSLTVSLTSSSAAITVPGSVSIPAGKSSAAFTINSGLVSGSQSASITAALNGSSQSTTLTVSAPVLSAGSVTPSGAAGISQTFSFTFSDSQSAANFSAAAFLIAPSLAYANACLIVYDQTRGTVQLEWNNVAGADSKPVTATTILQNSQCSIGATSVTSNGLVTTINVAISFNASFSGVKNIYMYGSDAGGAVNTGWVQKGTYSVTATAPLEVTAVSATPNAATGSSQSFSFVFSDSQSASNLSAAAFLIAPSLTYSNACLVVYDATRGTIQLETDSAASATVKAVTSTTVLQNSQCSIGATSVSTAGLNSTISLQITFTSAFAGAKNIYIYGADTGGAINTGWVHEGTYTVTSALPPLITAVSVTPSGGAGGSQTFSFVFSDSQSAANLSAAAFLFAPALVLPNSCLIVYDRARGTIQLESDNVTGASERPIDSTTPLQNSQCTVGVTSVTTSALTNTINIAITFNTAFSGLKNIYMYGADTDGSINTGWVPIGAWTPY